MQNKTIYCPCCGSEKVYAYDNQPVSQSMTMTEENASLDTEIYAYGRCFKCEEKFTLTGLITWQQPIADKNDLPQVKGWTIYHAVTDAEKQFLSATWGVEVDDYNGGDDEGSYITHVYISNKGFNVCRRRDGRFYAQADRCDGIGTFEEIVNFVEKSLGEKLVADKRFVGVWSTYEYPQNEMRILKQDDITEDQGYSEYDLNKVKGLIEGQSTAIGRGGHIIMRLPDSFADGLVSVPLNTNGTVSLTNEDGGTAGMHDSQREEKESQYHQLRSQGVTFDLSGIAEGEEHLYIYRKGTMIDVYYPIDRIKV